MDNDDDGYDTGTDTGCVALDCNDDLAKNGDFVNPAMPEYLSTDDDDDCDGYLELYQLLEAGMSTGAWWDSYRTTWPGDTARLAPTPADGAWIELKSGFAWSRGELHVAVGVKEQVYGATEAPICTVSVDTDVGGTDHATFDLDDGAANGWQWNLALDGLLPPFSVDRLEIECEVAAGPAGVGTPLIDYVSVLNGDYQWPYPSDQQLDFDEAGFPGGGYGGSVVGTTLGEGDVHGLTTAPWAPDTVFAWGSATGPDALCEIAVGGASTTWDPLAKTDTKKRLVKRVEPHPHLAETLLVGVAVQNATTSTVWGPPQLYQAAWRLGGFSGLVRPDWRKFPDIGLSNQNVNGIAFDVDESAEPYSVERIWVSTAGSGVYDRARTWPNP